MFSRIVNNLSAFGYPNNTRFSVLYAAAGCSLCCKAAIFKIRQTKPTGNPCWI